METKVTIKLNETVEFTDLMVAQTFVENINALIRNANRLTPAASLADVTVFTRTGTTPAVEAPAGTTAAPTPQQPVTMAASVQTMLTAPTPAIDPLTTQLSPAELANVSVPTEAQIQEALVRVREERQRPKAQPTRNEVLPPAPRQTQDWTDAATDRATTTAGPTPVVVTEELRGFSRLRDVVSYLISTHNIRSRRALIDACKALTGDVPLLANMNLDERVPKAIDVIDRTIGA